MKLVTQRINDWNTPHATDNYLVIAPQFLKFFLFLGGGKQKLHKKKLTFPLLFGENYLPVGLGAMWRLFQAFCLVIFLHAEEFPEAVEEDDHRVIGRCFCGENAPISMQSIDLNS